MHKYEVEIKSLLGGKPEADALIAKMKTTDPNFGFISQHSQLNHYFIDGDLNILYKNIVPFLDQEKGEKFRDITQRAKDYSVRTRQADDRVLIVIKASVDDTTSANGTARLEFEEETRKLSLPQLDELVLKSGFKYQAKWSRERQEYQFKDLSVSIDKNAGYGYLAEFEALVDNTDIVEETKKRVREIMQELGVEELDQARLARMFDYYNNHWQDYYGTDKTFTIK